MAVTLKIKRSQTTNIPTDLQPAELAYSELSKKLFIGYGDVGLAEALVAGTANTVEIGGEVHMNRLRVMEDFATDDQLSNELYFSNHSSKPNREVVLPGDSAGLQSLADLYPQDASNTPGSGSILTSLNVTDALIEIDKRVQLAEANLSDDSDMEDLVGGMFTAVDPAPAATNGSTVPSVQKGISLVYNETTRRIDVDVNDPVITLAGPVTGQVTMTDLGDITINTTIEPDTVTLGVQTEGQYAENIHVAGGGLGSAEATDANGEVGGGLSITTNNTNDGTNYVITSNATKLNTANTIAYRTEDGSLNAVDLNASRDLNVDRNAVIAGNLTVHGTTTTVNSTTVTYDDPVLTLGGDETPTLNTGKDSGIEFKWHDGTNAKVGYFGFDESTGNFTYIPDATNASEVFAGDVGFIDAKLNGNAKTATDLESPLTIQFGPSVSDTKQYVTGDVVFTGSEGTVTLDLNIEDNTIELGDKTTGDYAKTVKVITSEVGAPADYISGTVAAAGTTGTGLIISAVPDGVTGATSEGNVQESVDYVLSTNATSANTNGAIVLRSATGEFSATRMDGTARDAERLTTAVNFEVTTSANPVAATSDATSLDYDKNFGKITGAIRQSDNRAVEGIDFGTEDDPIVFDIRAEDDPRYLHIWRPETILGEKTFRKIANFQSDGIAKSNLQDDVGNTAATQYYISMDGTEPTSGEKTALDNFVVDGGTF